MTELISNITSTVSSKRYYSNSRSDLTGNNPLTIHKKQNFDSVSEQGITISSEISENDRIIDELRGKILLAGINGIDNGIDISEDFDLDFIFDNSWTIKGRAKMLSDFEFLDVFEDDF